MPSSLGTQEDAWHRFAPCAAVITQSSSSPPPVSASQAKGVKVMIRLGLLFSHSAAHRVYWLPAFLCSEQLGDITIPRAEPWGRQSRWLSPTAKKIREEREREEGSKTCDTLVLISKCFHFKWQILLVQGEFYQ